MTDQSPPTQPPSASPPGSAPVAPPPLVPSGGYTWTPTGQPPPVEPASVHHGGSPSQQRRGGIAGGIIAAAIGLAKYGFLLLKFGKLGGTVISFGLSLLVYIGLFGWQFGLGAILLIAVHEFGHVFFAKLQRLPMSMPIFLFGFGAVTRVAGFRDARQEAIVAIGGPVTGTGAALLCLLFAQLLPEGNLRYLMLALAYWGCLINLFNLIPMSPLDGGRIASGVSKWTNVAGIAIVVLMIAAYAASGAALNPFLVIILLFGIYSTWGRFRRARDGQEPPPLPSGTRLAIGVAYLAVLVISALGMSVAHSTLLNHGIGHQIV